MKLRVQTEEKPLNARSPHSCLSDWRIGVRHNSDDDDDDDVVCVCARVCSQVRGTERRPGRVTAVSFCKYTPPLPALHPSHPFSPSTSWT